MPKISFVIEQCSRICQKCFKCANKTTKKLGKYLFKQFLKRLVLVIFILSFMIKKKPTALDDYYVEIGDEELAMRLKNVFREIRRKIGNPIPNEFQDLKSQKQFIAQNSFVFKEDPIKIVKKIFDDKNPEKFASFSQITGSPEQSQFDIVRYGTYWMKGMVNFDEAKQHFLEVAELFVRATFDEDGKISFIRKPDPDDDRILKSIKQFQNEEEFEERIIQIYSEEAFFYPLLNNGLRKLQELQEKSFLRLPVKILCRAIVKFNQKEQIKKNFKTQQKMVFYRGCDSSEKESENLQNLQNQYIQLEGFVSTSILKTHAQQFGKKLMFRIEVEFDDYEELNCCYAKLRSKKPEEEEVLIAPHTIFKIVSYQKEKYVKVNKEKLDLVTLKFSTENEIVNDQNAQYIGTVQEEYKKIFDYLPNKKVVLTEDSHLNIGITYLKMAEYKKCQAWFLNYFEKTLPKKKFIFQVELYFTFLIMDSLLENLQVIDEIAKQFILFKDNLPPQLSPFFQVLVGQLSMMCKDLVNEDMKLNLMPQILDSNLLASQMKAEKVDKMDKQQKRNWMRKKNNEFLTQMSYKVFESGYHEHFRLIHKVGGMSKNSFKNPGLQGIQVSPSLGNKKNFVEKFVHNSIGVGLTKKQNDYIFNNKKKMEKKIRENGFLAVKAVFYNLDKFQDRNYPFLNVVHFGPFDISPNSKFFKYFLALLFLPIPQNFNPESIILNLASLIIDPFLNFSSFLFLICAKGQYPIVRLIEVFQSLKNRKVEVQFVNFLEQLRKNKIANVFEKIQIIFLEIVMKNIFNAGVKNQFQLLNEFIFEHLFLENEEKTYRSDLTQYSLKVLLQYNKNEEFGEFLLDIIKRKMFHNQGETILEVKIKIIHSQVQKYLKEKQQREENPNKNKVNDDEKWLKKKYKIHRAFQKLLVKLKTKSTVHQLTNPHLNSHIFKSKKIASALSENQYLIKELRQMKVKKTNDFYEFQIQYILVCAGVFIRLNKFDIAWIWFSEIPQIYEKTVLSKLKPCVSIPELNKKQNPYITGKRFIAFFQNLFLLRCNPQYRQKQFQDLFKCIEDKKYLEAGMSLYQIRKDQIYFIEFWIDQMRQARYEKEIIEIVKALWLKDKKEFHNFVVDYFDYNQQHYGMCAEVKKEKDHNGIYYNGYSLQIGNFKDGKPHGIIIQYGTKGHYSQGLFRHGRKEQVFTYFKPDGTKNKIEYKFGRIQKKIYFDKNGNETKRDIFENKPKFGPPC